MIKHFIHSLCMQEWQSNQAKLPGGVVARSGWRLTSCVEVIVVHKASNMSYIRIKSLWGSLMELDWTEKMLLWQKKKKNRAGFTYYRGIVASAASDERCAFYLSSKNS